MFDKVEKKLAFEPTCVHRSPDSSLLAFGDTSGGVGVYRYPCTSREVSRDMRVFMLILCDVR